MFVKVLWSGEWKDGVLTLFCDSGDETVRTLHYKIACKDGEYAGTVDLSGIQDPEKKLNCALNTIEKWYMQEILSYRDFVIQHGQASLH